MSRNIGIFAAGDVGLEVIRYLEGCNESLSCVVFDANDTTDCSKGIQGIAQRITDHVLGSDTLQEQCTLEFLASLELDILILAWWPYIIDEKLIDMPKIGALNFHPSYLPHNRGKHYNFWALVEEAPFGVSLHFVEKSIDSGDIAFQSRISTSWEDTGETLYRKAQSAILNLFKECFPIIKEKEIPRQPQDLQQGSFHLAGELTPASEIVLDRQYTARQLLNLLRARTFAPHPGCRFTDNGETFEIRVEISKITDSPEDG